MADWRKESDPRKVFVLMTLHRLMTEGMSAEDPSKIFMEPLPVWQNGLGGFEAARTIKKDLTALGKTE